MGNKAVQFQYSIIALLNLFTHLFDRNERTVTQTVCSDAFSSCCLCYCFEKTALAKCEETKSRAPTLKGTEKV